MSTGAHNDPVVSSPDRRQVADYERAMRLLREDNEYAQHDWRCKGEGAMKKGCTCGLEAVDEMVEKEIQRWREGCGHDLVVEAGNLVWCKRCYWHGTQFDGGIRTTDPHTTP